MISCMVYKYANIKINALASLGVGKPLVAHSFNSKMGVTDVVVKVDYRSLYAGDAFFVDNFWSDTKYPLVPGTEYMGSVVMVGDQVTNIKIGDYVGVGYQVSSCGACIACVAGTPQYCRTQEVICVNRPGGLADYAIADSRFVFPLPRELRHPEYVSLMCSGLTVFSALKQAHLEPGAKVGIVGVGNLGHWAIQLGNSLGYHVDAFSHTPDKLDKIRALGAKNVHNSVDYPNFASLERTHDFILVTTYANLDWAKYLSLLTPTGKICFVGLPKDRIAIPAVSLADYAGRAVSGGYLGAPRDYPELFRLVIKHNLKGAVEVYPFTRANLVLDKIRNQELRFCAALVRE